jgi:hypothetical protein
MVESKMTDKITAREKSAFEAFGAATEETRHLAKNSCLTALEAAQEYNAKLFEFARINSEAAFGYAQELSGVSSPSGFIEITTRHARERLAAMTEQAKELVAIGQKAVAKSTAPSKS